MSHLPLDLESLAAMRAAFACNLADVRATFECVFEPCDPHHGFFVLAGLGPLLQRLEGAKPSAADLQAAGERGLVDAATIDTLRSLRLACDIDAALEGSVVFAQVPVLTVEGPFWQAQWVAQLASSWLAQASRVATASARWGLAAGGGLGERPLVALGVVGSLSEAELARAAFVGGASASPSFAASSHYGVPVALRYGMQAVGAARGAELDVEAWLEAAPPGALLPLAPEDATLSIARLATAVANLAARSWEEPRFALELPALHAYELAQRTQQAFKAKSLRMPQLYVNAAGYDEPGLREVMAELGPGTGVVVEPQPQGLRMRCELSALEENGRWMPRLRRGVSLAHSSEPGRKKVVRYLDKQARPLADVAFAANERISTAREVEIHDARSGVMQLVSGGRNVPLLHRVFRGGQSTEAQEPLAAVRARAIDEVMRLAPGVRRLRWPTAQATGVSRTLLELKHSMLAEG